MTKVTRRYEPETLILETIFETATGTVSVSDFMPPYDGHSMIHRIVETRTGTVEMQMELIVRYKYGAITPWATSTGDGLVLVAGRDGLRLHSPVPLIGRDNTTVASFSMSADIRRSFSLTWFPSETHAPLPLDGLAARNHTRHYWHNWVARCTYNGGSRDLVVRSLITLKALTYQPTGAVCAAATTSLPETIGGSRNWDYRYSWLRDSTFTLHALLISGYTDEAAAWVRWLRRAVAGNPGEMQIMYGVDGERRLPEFELDYLAGYEGSTPVRIGNQAVTQLQLDVYGEILDSAVTYWQSPIPKESDVSPDLVMAILDHLEKVWREPDNGIWEVRGPRRNFTHSKVMAWVAFDRAVTLTEEGVLPKDPWTIGSSSATRSTRMSATRASIVDSTRSPSTTAPSCSMRVCSCSHQSASCHPMTRASSEPSTRFRKGWSPMGSSVDTKPTQRRRSTAYKGPRAHS